MWGCITHLVHRRILIPEVTGPNPFLDNISLGFTKDSSCKMWLQVQSRCQPAELICITLCFVVCFSVLTYKIEVHTSSDEGSSSNANAYITIHGSRADTGKRDLWKSDKPVKFQLGQVCRAVA